MPELARTHLAQGEAIGEAKRYAGSLNVVFKKLPKWVTDQLATATSAQLEEWAIRLVDKKSLSAIFDRD